MDAREIADFRGPANLDLGHYPYLPAANVKTTSAADYMVLVSGRAMRVDPSILFKRTASANLDAGDAFRAL
jgi:hypothetical protein